MPQLINLRTRFPAGEAYVHTLDIAAAWYGSSRMKSFGKTPSWLRLLWLGLQIEQHLQRRILRGFPGTEEHSRELAKPRPSSCVRRHFELPRLETWRYVSIHGTCTRRHSRSDACLARAVPQSLFAVVLLPLSKTGCSWWWARGGPLTVSPETRCSTSWSHMHWPFVFYNAQTNGKGIKVL